MINGSCTKDELPAPPRSASASEGWPVAAETLAADVSRRTSYKRLNRFKTKGKIGLLGRSSRP